LKPQLLAAKRSETLLACSIAKGAVTVRFGRARKVKAMRASDLSDLEARSAMPHPGRNVQQEIDFILCHESPVLFGTVADDVKQSLGRVEELGDDAVPHIVSAVTGCATGGCPGPRFWDGAGELCKLLSRLRSPSANAGLLSILRTDSNIVEFDEYVRGSAAAALGASGDQALVEELASCLDLPNAPYARIAQAIEALGGSVSENPAVILDRGRRMQIPVEAIRYLLGHRSSVPAWPENMQGEFYFILGRKVHQEYDFRKPLSDRTKALYAAALRANPSPRSVVWEEFSESERRETAQTLSTKYPLSDGYWEALKVAVESSDVV